VSFGAGGLIVELATAHLLPTLAVELARYALNQAGDRTRSRRFDSARRRREEDRSARDDRARRAGHGSRSQGTSVWRTSAQWPRHLTLLRDGPPSSATVLSSTPGRLRLRVSHLRGLPARAAALTAKMSSLPGTLSARASALTGTLLVEYDPTLTTVDTIRRALDTRETTRRTPTRARRQAPAGTQLRLVGV
jgi:hypothetical protein